MTPRIPTELDLLSTIYDRHYRAFADFSDQNKNRVSKIWVPIDIAAIARRFRVDDDIVFGILYYHLNEKYAGRDAQGNATAFFHTQLGSDRHVVNFPLMAGVLASLQDDRSKFRVATGVAVLSLFVSGVSLLVAVFA